MFIMVFIHLIMPLKHDTVCICYFWSVLNIIIKIINYIISLCNHIIFDSFLKVAPVVAIVQT